MSTTCEYNPVQSTLLNSPDLEGRADVMSGKYAISCLGGPEGILESLAKRSADCVKALRAGAEVNWWEEYLRRVRGRAVLIIVRETIDGVKVLRMNDVPRYDVYDRIHLIWRRAHQSLGRGFLNIEFIALSNHWTPF